MYSLVLNRDITADARLSTTGLGGSKGPSYEHLVWNTRGVHQNWEQLNLSNNPDFGIREERTSYTGKWTIRGAGYQKIYSGGKVGDLLVLIEVDLEYSTISSYYWYIHTLDPAKEFSKTNEVHINWWGMHKLMLCEDLYSVFSHTPLTILCIW